MVPPPSLNKPDLVDDEQGLTLPSFPMLDYLPLLFEYTAMSPQQRAELKRREGVPTDDDEANVDEPIKVDLNEDDPRRHVYEEFARCREHAKDIGELLSISAARTNRHEQQVADSFRQVCLYQRAYAFVLMRHRLLQNFLQRHKAEVEFKVELFELAKADTQDLEDKMRREGYDV